MIATLTLAAALVCQSPPYHPSAMLRMHGFRDPNRHVDTSPKVSYSPWGTLYTPSKYAPPGARDPRYIPMWQRPGDMRLNPPPATSHRRGR